MARFSFEYRKDNPHFVITLLAIKSEALDIFSDFKPLLVS